MDHEAFVQRVLERLPPATPEGFTFSHWSHADRPTDEGFGLMPVPSADPDQLIAAVMDVDHYVGNVEHVTICRSIPDERFTPPASVRFYQKVTIPVLGAVHHELVIHDLGELRGYRIAAWDLLQAETDALSTRDGFRSDYNTGAWLAAPGVVGYALASAPKRGDVGFLKWKALTKGADAAASRVLRANIEGMAAWSRRR
ncbi:MAG TPA: hypothetical protein ENK18_03520 [Deltaproteobacteria bacterium]|nr:hypothetical protein [Deltaproteobacteria bacterium]